MNVKFTNIDWETDGEEVDLPTELMLEVADDVDLDEDGADFLSDKYDFLVNGFDYEIIEDITFRRNRSRHIKLSLLAAATTVDASILLENEEISKMLREDQSLERLMEYVDENF